MKICNQYELRVDPNKKMCHITFLFEETPYTMPTRYYPEIEDDIRRNFYVWRAHAIAYCKQRARVDLALDSLFAISPELMKGMICND